MHSTINHQAPFALCALLAIICIQPASAQDQQTETQSSPPAQTTTGAATKAPAKSNVVPQSDSPAETTAQEKSETQKSTEPKQEPKKQPDKVATDPKPAKDDPKGTASDTAVPNKTPQPPSVPAATNLLQGPFAKTWKLFAAEEGVAVEQVWQIKKGETDSDNILVCTGKPKGYLRTVAPHSNYKLTFEFRYPTDANGNSGVLLHLDGKEKIWPDAVQVQLHRPTAGSILPCGNRKTRFTVGASLELLVKTWNKCEITVIEDTIEVRINKLSVGPLKYCDPAKGFIALQAEGSEVHFRKVYLQPIPLKSTPDDAPKLAGDKPPKPAVDQTPAATQSPGKEPAAGSQEKATAKENDGKSGSDAASTKAGE